jgi:nucleotide-binding universal stress UspA family protein
LDANDYKPLIYCDNGEGKLGTVVPDIIETKNVELIVMGAREDDPDKDNLFGSDLNAVIQKSTRPMMVVPPGVDPFNLKKVVFATNFEKADVHAINYLVKLGDLFGFELEIVHFIQQVNGSDNKRAEEAAEQEAGLKYPNIIYHHLGNKDVVDNILQIYEDSGAGLLALVHHQHSLIGRILHQSVTKKILNNRHMPLMIFPSKMG